MEISPWLLYFVMQADTIIETLKISLIILSVCCILTFPFVFCENWSKKTFYWWIMPIFLTLLVALLPSTKSLSIIIGVPIVIEMVNSDKGQQVQDDMLTILHGYAEEYKGNK